MATATTHRTPRSPRRPTSTRLCSAPSTSSILISPQPLDSRVEIQLVDASIQRQYEERLWVSLPRDAGARGSEYKVSAVLSTYSYPTGTVVNGVVVDEPPAATGDDVVCLQLETSDSENAPESMGIALPLSAFDSLIALLQRLRAAVRQNEGR